MTEIIENQELIDSTNSDNELHYDETCDGCMSDQPNQLAHMDCGGCLHDIDNCRYCNSVIDTIDEADYIKVDLQK